MATKICFAPYLCGPELESKKSKPASVGGSKNFLARIRAGIRAMLNPSAKPAAAAQAESRGHWAYRVVNSPLDSAIDQSCHRQRPLSLAVEVCDLDLVAVEPAQLQPGDLIVAEAGQTIFADGTILAGMAVVDESAITGQSEPLVCSADSRSRVMRESYVVAGQILVRIADRRGHPLDWIDSPPEPRVLTQSALRRAAAHP